MSEQQPCKCQSGTHGHEPGKCPNPGTEDDGYCRECHERAIEFSETQMP
jgi:hypothetical protein